MQKSLVPSITELESLFSTFNKKFYEGKLPDSVITLNPDSTRGAFGWCTSWKAWKENIQEKAGYYEINICAEYLNRPLEEICETLLHEMVHLWNLENNIKDTCRDGYYHNKNFKDAAEQHGLNVSPRDSKYGWFETSLNEAAREIIENVQFDSFVLYRDSKGKQDIGKRKSSSRKYYCPQCKTIIRATKKIQIICKKCSCEYIQEEIGTDEA